MGAWKWASRCAIRLPSCRRWRRKRPSIRCIRRSARTASWTTPCPWPAGVPAGSFGPRLTGVAGLVSGCYRSSTRTVAEILRDLFGVSISLGSVVACEQAVSRAVAPAVEEARSYVQKQAVANVDETSWRERRRKAWLWIMATAFVIVFLIHQRRNRAAARELLGSFKGTLGSDRWTAYHIHTGRRQICWSHLERDFHAMSEYKGKAGRIGKELVRLTRKMFRWWHGCARRDHDQSAVQEEDEAAPAAG